MNYKTKILTIVLIFIYLFICAVVVSVAQDTTLSVTGHIMDETTGNPVTNHLVLVTVTGSGFYEDYEFYTNDAGYYGNDSILAPGQGLVRAATIDCIGEEHAHEEYFNPGNYSFVFDFEICNDSIPQGDCENWFFYETWNNLDFTFIGESFPPADIYLWDFGDGYAGTGQIATHSYDPNINDFISVILTTIAIDPASGDSCFALSEQQVWVGSNGGDCFADFEYTVDSTPPGVYLAQFTDMSIGEPTNWFWEFGDGEYSEEQNPEHIYYEQGIYLVCLTIMGDSINCYDMVCEEVIIGGMNDCEANFYYVQDNLNELTINFFDSSSGLITYWFWDFGDGDFSEETNPIHTYSDPGIYQVCLSVFSDSLGFFCSDTYCSNTEIEYSLSSDFSFSLDTISGLTNNYYFTDISIGNPETWFWDFGDGNVSTLQNPVHQFSETGEYEICLEVSRSFPNSGTYTVTYCQTLETPNYFDFGGQVFIDGFPLNNYNGDTTIVDTGMAFLYRKYDNSLIPIDTNIFYDYGYYWFSQVREGDYIVKTGLTENSLNHNNYVTSYHENALYWDKANTLYLYDTNYLVNVDLIELLGIDQGPGSISGFVTVSDKDFLNPLLVSEIEILLFDNDYNPLTFTITDESGNFAFENIPLGSYKLYAEATGFISFEVSVYLDENNQSVSNINLELYEQTVGIEEYFESVTAVGNIYPNPVREKFSVDIQLDDNADLLINIFNINGQKVKEQQLNLNKGSHTLSFNGDVLPHGVYLVLITSGDRKIIETRKFVK